MILVRMSWKGQDIVKKKNEEMQNKGGWLEMPLKDLVWEHVYNDSIIYSLGEQTEHDICFLLDSPG